MIQLIKVWGVLKRSEHSLLHSMERLFHPLYRPQPNKNNRSISLSSNLKFGKKIMLFCLLGAKKCLNREYLTNENM